MAIKTVKFLSVVYDTHRREKYKNRIIIIGGPSRKISLTYKASTNSAYTNIEGKAKDKLRITIGGEFIKKVAVLPESFSDRKIIKPMIPQIFKSFDGAFYHELGHCIFTDMVCDAIIHYKEPKYINFIHSMFNILEDQVIEFFMEIYFKKHYPYDINPRVYFQYLIESVFIPQAEEYKDDGTQNGFMNYLLLFFRCGESKIKNKNAIWEKYKTDLTPRLKKVLHELDATNRIHYTIELCEWIIENIKEFNWEMPEPEETHSGKGAGGEGIPAPAKGPSSMSGFGGGHDEEGAEGEAPGKPEEGADEKEKEDSKDDSEEDEKESEDSPEEAMIEKDVDEEVYDTVFNDDIRDGDEHAWSIAKDDFEIKDDSVIEDIDKIIEKNLSTIRNVSDFLTLFKGRIKPMRMEGMTSGRLAVRKAIANEIAGGCNTRLFKKKLARGRDADLVVSLLCDNSGSMSGEKSRICSNACIVLAQACEWSGIPYEINAFVKTFDGYDGISYTIVEKAFEDTLEQAKPYLAINDGKLLYEKIRKINSGVPTFAGNSEEVNIFYIWQKFKKVKHRTKLMFVLCDGMTTGSSDALHKVVTKMESEDNIIVIGIGILCSDVTRSYNHAKVFNSMSELEAGLGPYLIDTLSKYAV